ncbi:MAG: hypothetical protein AAGF85_04260 [Bacteroidota bacterium]
MSDKNHHIEIPKEFHSYSTGSLFDQCIDCEKHLLEDKTEYFIEKAIKQYDGFSAQEIIFEYAICIDCAERVRKSISQKSMRAIEKFFLENIDFNKRMNLMNANPENPSAWISNCLVSNSSVNDLTEYQIFAHCNGRSLNLSQMPYMVGGNTLEQLQYLLSSETRDELNDFMEKNLGPSPELAEILPGSRIVLI